MSDTTPKTILVVDDNEDILSSLGALLKKKGFSVGLASDSTETYAYLKENRPDMLLLDVRLLGESGASICENLKSDPKTKDIPIVMMSAHPDGEIVARASQAEAFIPKPISLSKVLDAVEAYCKPAIN